MEWQLEFTLHLMHHNKRIALLETLNCLTTSFHGCGLGLWLAAYRGLVCFLVVIVFSTMNLVNAQTLNERQDSTFASADSNFLILDHDINAQWILPDSTDWYEEYQERTRTSETANKFKGELWLRETAGSSTALNGIDHKYAAALRLTLHNNESRLLASAKISETDRTSSQPSIDRLSIQYETGESVFHAGSFTTHVGLGLITCSPYANAPRLSNPLHVARLPPVRSGGNAAVLKSKFGVAASSLITIDSVPIHLSIWHSRDDLLQASRGFAHEVGGYAGMHLSSVRLGAHAVHSKQFGVAGSIVGMATLERTELSGEVGISQTYTAFGFGIRHRLESRYSSVYVTTIGQLPRGSPAEKRQGVLPVHFANSVQAGLLYRCNGNAFRIESQWETDRPVDTWKMWRESTLSLLLAHSWNNAPSTVVQSAYNALRIENSMHVSEVAPQTTWDWLSKVNMRLATTISAIVSCGVHYTLPTNDLGINAKFELQFKNGIACGAVLFATDSTGPRMYSAAYVLQRYTMLLQSNENKHIGFARYNSKLSNNVHFSAFALCTQNKTSTAELDMGIQLKVALGQQ